MNRPLLHKARALFRQSRLDQYRRSEVLLPSTVLRSRTAPSPLDMKILHELLYGRPTRKSNLTIFRWDAYLHVHKENRKTKLSNRVTSDMHIGSQDGLHHVYIRERRELVAAKHVTFEETFSHYHRMLVTKENWYGKFIDQKKINESNENIWKESKNSRKLNQNEIGLNNNARQNWRSKWVGSDNHEVAQNLNMITSSRPDDRHVQVRTLTEERERNELEGHYPQRESRPLDYFCYTDCAELEMKMNLCQERQWGVRFRSMSREPRKCTSTL